LFRSRRQMRPHRMWPTGLVFIPSSRAEAPPIMQLIAPAAATCMPFRQRAQHIWSSMTWLTVSVVLLVGVAMGCSPTYAADEWPQFRGPSGDGIAADSSVPLHWDQETNVR